MFKIAFGYLIVFIILIVVFAEIYKYVDGISNTESYYHSTMIMTLVGGEYPEKSDTGKIVSGIQSIISYAITSGAVLWLYHTHDKKHVSSVVKS